ncbi:hypothetical protein RHMOL_Rhmol13G0126100 [Rhododendron molle]|uniref:Uncharacterized protein n=1 Tax=Rhododendron molle TaxID=49168 RepID=A0ACC0L6K4_RHOML|nr:hypothetical protein RHMOL_Rhmol13G0126100 [Rhododendron molle]
MESKTEGTPSEVAPISQPEDSPMEPQRETRTTMKEISKPIEKARSFKATLLNEYQSTETPEASRAEFDDLSDDEDMEVPDPPKTKSRIKVNFSKDHLKRIRQQYRGLFTPVDLGLGFYLIRFETRSDYNKVYTGGPWVIQDHYLIVRKWQPDFKADRATAIKTAVWMRFPFLPYEYYDEESLFEIAKELGKPLKVDINTINGIRASYARVCVELDLSQPLEISVAIRNEDYLIEYEHIHLICFECGRVGHRRDSCSFKAIRNSLGDGEQVTVAAPVLTVPKPVSFNGNTVPDVSEGIGYGEWMVVSRRKERRNGPVVNGPRKVQAQRGKSAAQSVNLPNGKPNQNPSPQYRPRGQNENGAGPSNQPMTQQTQTKDTSTNPRPRQSETRSKPPNSASAKDNHQLGHRYDDNPLLRKPRNPSTSTPVVEIGATAQGEIHPNRPIFSPVSNMEVVLDIPNPNSTQNKQPPHLESSALTPLKKPPDIITYHEFARTTECNRELPQGEHGDRFRQRSRSPNKSGLVARGAEAQSQALGSCDVEDSQSHGITEANGAAGASQGKDPQAPRPI